MSDKRQMIIDGLIALAKSKNDISTISVQAIANQAKVKKATIYDYFSSKEEIFEDTIIFLCTKQINNLIFKLDSENCFDRCIDIIFDDILENVENQLSVFNLFYGISNRTGIIDYNLESKYSEMINNTRGIIKNVIELGVKEKKFEIPADSQYIIVMVNALIHASTTCAIRASYFGEDYSQSKKSLYKILIKSMN